MGRLRVPTLIATLEGDHALDLSGAKDDDHLSPVVDHVLNSIKILNAARNSLESPDTDWLLQYRSDLRRAVESLIFAAPDPLYQVGRAAHRPTHPLHDFSIATCLAGLELFEYLRTNKADIYVAQLALNLPGLSGSPTPKTIAGWRRKQSSLLIPEAKDLLEEITEAVFYVDEGEVEYLAHALFDRESPLFLGGVISKTLRLVDMRICLSATHARASSLNLRFGNLG